MCLINEKLIRVSMVLIENDCVYLLSVLTYLNETSSKLVDYMRLFMQFLFFVDRHKWETVRPIYYMFVQ